MEDKTRGGQARGSPDNIRKSKTVKKENTNYVTEC